MITKHQLWALHPRNWKKSKTMTDTIKSVTKGVDVEKLAYDYASKTYTLEDDTFKMYACQNGFKEGYNQALQSTDKRFSLEDMREALKLWSNYLHVCNIEKLTPINYSEWLDRNSHFIKSLIPSQPKN